MTPTMDALVWMAPRVMQLERVAIPQPAAGEVLIAVGAVGICGSELSGYLGQSSIRVPPLVMGHEAAGRVVQAGDTPLADGTTVGVGQRVAFNPLIVCGTCDCCRRGQSNICRNRRLIGAHAPGAFAAYVAVPAGQCYPLRDGISDVAGSLTEPLACGVRAVRLAAPAERLLILGAGPIGLCCLVAARAAGIEQITITDIAEQRLAVARAWGATATINTREADLPAATETLAPGGFDAVIDAVGAAATRTQALQAAVPGGRAVFLGLHDEHTSIHANYLVRQEIAILGSFAYTAADFSRAFELISHEAIRATADWLEERPLAAGPESFEELLAGRAGATKIVLRV
ncbi:MAG TPA: alcohol dehydrogenase catalytic domain-containing protein [Roseiflexaceae bacterium]|nr:alcohol dehydrogenase catalytic domain-containing protein [Roseiflexaceae bacterium]HMP39141.1 alcohol dehydrogenase catalytic domain-containing protein [Roseiflexaceae bacterium]